MTLPIQTAFEVLQATRDAQRADPRLEQRLAEVQAMLAEDLTWVESTLTSVAGVGVAPATDAARHLLARGGKRIRPLTTLLSAACFGEIPAAVRELAMVSELIHSSTLLHDDVVDEGMVRRGAATSRMVWGNAISVLSGDLLLTHALKSTLDHAPGLMAELVDTLRQLVDGEVIQLRGRTTFDLSEATYEQILRGKTASLFVFSARAGARLAGAAPRAEQALADFGQALGMAFQLVDDVLDYAGESSGKTLVADLREGKLTLPLVLAADVDPQLLELARLLHAGEPVPIEGIRRRVVDSGACNEVRRRAAEYTEKAVSALEAIPLGPARRLLEGVAIELVERHG